MFVVLSAMLYWLQIYLSKPWYRAQHFLYGMASKLPFCSGHTLFNFIYILFDSIYKSL